MLVISFILIILSFWIWPVRVMASKIIRTASYLAAFL
ncbi:hypothetical protein KFU94_37290 [Chloroflexi bacterium TSY]|nr:hypothetical protein [Chloroflexi bacterium TSY]